MLTTIYLFLASQKIRSIKLKGIILNSFAITIIQFIVTYLVLKCYFGWYDDIMILHYLNGEIIHNPSGFFYLLVNQFTGNLYILLYKIDGVNWYGILLYLFIFISVLNINSILYYLISPRKAKGFLLFIFLSISFYIAYIVENVYLLNFTRVGLLLIVSSFISIILLYKSSYNIPSKKGLYILFSILFFIGFSTRPPVSILFLPLFGLFFLIFFKFKEALKLNMILAIFTLVYVGLSWFTLSNEKKEGMRAMFKTEKYIVNILDGFNGDSSFIESKSDSIKFAALNNWYFADQDTLLNQDFLKRAGSSHPFNNHVLKNWQNNLITEYQRASTNYTDRYLPQLNWWNKTLGFAIILFLLPFIMFFSKNFNGKKLINIQLFLLGSIIYILVVTVLVKMEDRVLAPLLIFIFLALILNIKTGSKKGKLLTIIPLIVAFLFIGIPRCFDYYGISNQRAHDLRVKEYIKAEIEQNFANKYVFFDFYTMSVLETTPFKDATYPEKWVSGIEIWNRHHSYIEKINEVVGCQDWPCFYSNVAKDAENYIFFYSSDRIRLTEEYHDIIYNMNVQFLKISHYMVIQNFNHSFHWLPFDYGYYMLEHISYK